MYKFQLVESKDGIENYSNVVYEKELDDELLVPDNIDMIQEFASFLRDELIGKIHVTTRFILWKDTEIVYRGHFELFDGFFNHENSLMECIFSDIYAASTIVNN